MNRWAIGFIFLFFVSFLVLLFFQSPLSKIQQIEIRGNVTIKKQDILMQVQLVPGASFFEWDRDQAKQKLLRYPQVKSVNIEKRFPGKVEITIEERLRVALWMPADDTQSGQLYSVIDNGTVLEEPWLGKVDKPLLRGWKEKEVQTISQQLAQVEPEILRTISEIQPFPSDTYDDQVRVFTNDGNEIVTRISIFYETINVYRNYIDGNSRGIVHLTQGKDFGWFEPYVVEAPLTDEHERE